MSNQNIYDNDTFFEGYRTMRAGAHIASKDIEHVTKYDDNNVEMTDFRGLGLFDGVLICHYTYIRKYDYYNLCKTSKYKAYYLTDSDSIVYEE